MSKPVIGFIGLGLMGGNMVENLQKRGFEVVVMDLNKDAVAAVLARGNAKEASSPKELAEASDIASSRMIWDILSMRASALRACAPPSPIPRSPRSLQTINRH